MAVYEPLIQVATVECQVREDLCRNVNSSTKTIVFESSDSRNVENWKPYFRDLSFLGKHYLVRNLDGHKSIARHYTVCNAMQPEIY